MSRRKDPFAPLREHDVRVEHDSVDSGELVHDHFRDGYPRPSPVPAAGESLVDSHCGSLALAGLRDIGNHAEGFKIVIDAFVDLLYFMGSFVFLVVQDQILGRVSSKICPLECQLNPVE